MKCSRCGTCCKKGGPALHLEDLPLLGRNILAWADLVTLREGEPAFDQVVGRVLPLTAEMIKIAGKGVSWACRFHDVRGRACMIHESRPAECRALFCRDTTALAAMYNVDRATRMDIVPPDSALAELIREHDRMCPAGEAARLAEEAVSGDVASLSRLGELAALDQSFRGVFLERTGGDIAQLRFLFGRRLPEVISPLGVLRGPDGRLRVETPPIGD